MDCKVVQWARWGAAAGLLGWVGWAQAHPHGSIDCRAAVRFEAGGLRHVRGELWLDDWHSQRAAQLTRNSQGQEDAQMMRQFIFALKMQMGRANWLFGLEADGQSLVLTPQADPVLEMAADGRARIVIDYAAAPAQQAVQLWSLHCADPSYYFVTAFGERLPVAPPEGAAAELDVAKLADNLQRLGPARQHASAVSIEGCKALNLGSGGAGLPAPRTGMARLDWSCQP